MSKPNIPIACNMNALTDRAHHEKVGADLMPQAQTLTELTNGYRFDFPIEALTRVAEFVDGERRCCPFFHFTIDVQPMAKSVYLSITGSDEVKAFIKQELLPHVSHLAANQ